MKTLFVMFRPKYVNTYEPALRLLAERGHSIHFTFSVGRSSTGRKQFDIGPLELLARDFPQQVTWDDDPPTRDPRDGWFGIAYGIRVLGDYVRYLHPRYADAVLLRERVAERVRRFAKARTLWWVLQRVSGAAASDRLLRIARDLERAVPPSARITDYVRTQAPDVVLVTPLVDVASDQAEFVKSANALGIPSAMCVNSWDNLTNKGVIRVDPDAVILWNEAQRDEAVELHGVDAEHVVVTGAQKFDEWFARSPSRDAETFKRAIGVDPAQPYILYVCSSRFIAADEDRFVERWLAAVREKLGPIGVVLRPHPENGRIWRDADVARFGNAVVYPPEGAEVTGEEQRADFFDSLAHSAAVVGINTSAMIEAAIVGRGVYTILAGEFRGTQEGTLHFRHLLHENGGILHVAGTLDEHVAQLAQGLAEGEGDVPAFVESFVRPFGLGTAAAPIVAQAIEDLATQPARGLVRTPRSRMLHALLAPVAAAQRRGAQPDDGVIGLGDRVLGKQLELELRRVRRASGRIVVGPWVGDTAEELLYWIPYVRRLADRLELDRSKLVAVSHGSVAPWYADICGDYVELDEDLRQRAFTGWRAEREQVRVETLERLGVTDSISPAAMRRLFKNFRAGRAPLEIVWEFAEHRLIGDGHAGSGVVLEEELAGQPRGTQLELVRECGLLIARPNGLAALGVAAGVTTVAVADGDWNEADVELMSHVAQRTGGVTFTLLDPEQLAFLRKLV
ncbi:MAG TPA: hypothetical protein VGU02_00335 [Gaiellaceae bacterium]|nr:hypothetical protein [Gaiellaceae bacterium]